MIAVDLPSKASQLVPNNRNHTVKLYVSYRITCIFRFKLDDVEISGLKSVINDFVLICSPYPFIIFVLSTNIKHCQIADA